MSKLNETINRVLSDEDDVRAATAPYQQDFPYDRGDEAQVTRRTADFTPAQISGAETMSPNSSLNFHYPNEKDSAILVRSADGTYHAFGQQCTHLSCPVYYAHAHQRLECPCHEGAFDATTGNVLYGPPPRPLDMIEIEMRNR